MSCDGDSAIRRQIEAVEDLLHSDAVRSRESRGRATFEAPSPKRTAFQNDRERIIHPNAIRRMKHKTQVFIAPTGDHYVTRLSHTLEVTYTARTIARALNVNEDLVEAIALGHDLGHAPFGHVGEQILDEMATDGFSHSRQSLRIVDSVEGRGSGLNLTWESLEGIVKHNGVFKKKIPLEIKRYNPRPIGNDNVRKPNIRGIIQSIIVLVDCCLGSVEGALVIFCWTHVEAPTKTGIISLVGSGSARFNHKNELLSGIAS